MKNKEGRNRSLHIYIKAKGLTPQYIACEMGVIKSPFISLLQNSLVDSWSS